MSTSEREAYLAADRERTKAYRARKAAAAKGEAPPPEAVRPVRAGAVAEWIEEALPEPVPIGKLPIGTRCVMERLSPISEPLIYEIAHHWRDMAGTEIINRSRGSRTFTARDVDGEEKEVTIPATSRHVPICSWALVTHVLKPRIE